MSIQAKRIEGGLQIGWTPVTGVSGDNVLVFNSTTGLVSQVTQASIRGTIVVADIIDLTATAAEINVLDGITASTAELNYTDGVTSPIQTQLNTKQATITGAATTIVSANLTASRALIANGAGKVDVSTVTSTELGYVSGVTSALQTQLNTKLAVTVTSPATGDLVYYNGSSWVNFPRGTNGQTLLSTGTTIQWGAGTANGLPVGGVAGNVLYKQSGTNYDADWQDLVLADISDVIVPVAEINLLQGLTSTAVELNYSDGVTSAIQPQLDGKLSTSLAQNAIFVGDASNIASQLSAGSNGQVLQIVSGAPVWQTVTGTGTVTSVNVSGGTTGLSFTGGPVTTTGTITASGTLALANGGTGASLADPNADRILFWDDSAGAVTWLTVGTNLSITGTTLSATSGSSYTASNGITLTGSNFTLGGNITGNTLLQSSGHFNVQFGDSTDYLNNFIVDVADSGSFQLNTLPGSGSGASVYGSNNVVSITATDTVGAVAGAYLAATGGAGTGVIDLQSKTRSRFGLIDLSKQIDITPSGMTVKLGSDATGDIFYRDGGGFFTRLPVGTDGQVLTLASGLPSWGTGTALGAVFIDDTDSPYTILEGENGYIYYCDTSAGDITIDLDTTVSDQWNAAFVNLGTGLVVFDPGAQTLQAVDDTISTQYGAATVVYQGSSIYNAFGALGTGGGGSGTVTSVDVSGGTTGLTTSGGPVTTSGTITLSGTLVVANGGTGLTSLSAGRIPYGDGTNAFKNESTFTYDETLNTLDVRKITTGVLNLTNDSNQLDIIGSTDILRLTGVGSTITTLATISNELVVSSAPGNVGSIDGKNNSFTGGSAYTTSGNGNGGAILIQSGQRRTAGSGTDGNITVDPRLGLVDVLGRLRLAQYVTGSLPTVTEGAIVYDTTTNTVKYSDGASWIDVGTTTPDASTTVAGKVEQATASEVNNGTTTGGTGAPLFVNPGDLANIDEIEMALITSFQFLTQ